MVTDVDVLEEAFRRWEGWLAENFPADHFARRRGPSDTPSGDAVWQVEFQDGKLGRIHLTREALTLNRKDFARLTHRLDRTDWYGSLDELICIRIDSNGIVDEVPRDDR